MVLNNSATTDFLGPDSHGAKLGMTSALTLHHLNAPEH
jgi:hypothetical protein